MQHNARSIWRVQRTSCYLIENGEPVRRPLRLNSQIEASLSGGLRIEN